MINCLSFFFAFSLRSASFCCHSNNESLFFSSVMAASASSSSCVSLLTTGLFFLWCNAYIFFLLVLILVTFKHEYLSLILFSNLIFYEYPIQHCIFSRRMSSITIHILIQLHRTEFFLFPFNWLFDGYSRRWIKCSPTSLNKMC